MAMRNPLTAYGRREIVATAVATVGVGVLAWWLWGGGRPWATVVAAVVGLAVLAFFRDPEREVPAGAGLLVSPADGKVTDIGEVEEGEAVEFLGGPAVRIGIFLSVLDVHVNRSPCAGRVGYVQRRAGKCLNAMRWEAASRENASCSLGLECAGHPAGRVLVKQITGAIARRIVCSVGVGDELGAGERYGMIKFGSRTELFLPRDERAEMAVRVGDVVRGGRTVLVRYASWPREQGDSRAGEQ